MQLKYVSLFKYFMTLVTQENVLMMVNLLSFTFSIKEKVLISSKTRISTERVML